MPKVTPAKPDPDLGLAGTDPSGLEEADGSAHDHRPVDPGGVALGPDPVPPDVADRPVAPPVTTLPAPKPERDPIDVITGGKPYRVEYGFLDDVGLPYYAYGVGHGTTRATQHTGLDILIPYGTALHTPGAGVVLCVGTAGTPTWGQGCGAYTDTGDAPPGGRQLGVGNVTIMLHTGVKLTLGHCRQAFFKPGDGVKAGEKVATSGGQNGAHCHMETAIERNGTYWLVDPAKALKGTTPAPKPEPDVLPGVKPADLKTWFESVGGFGYHPGGPVTELWIAEGKATGQWPALTDVYKRPDKSTVFRFVNGWTVLSKAGKTWVARKEK